MRQYTSKRTRARRTPIREGFGEDLFRVTVYEDAFRDEFDSYESTDFGRVLDFANEYADGHMNFKFENEDTGESCKVTSSVWETAIDRDTYPSCVLAICDGCYAESLKKRHPLRESKGRIHRYHRPINESKFLDRVKYASNASKVANKYYKDIKRDPNCNDMSRADKRKEAIKRYFDNGGKYELVEESRIRNRVTRKQPQQEGVVMAKVAHVLAPIAYEVSADLITVLAQRLSEKLMNIDPDKIIASLKKNLGKINSFADIDKAVEKTYTSFAEKTSKTEGVEERDRIIDNAVENEVADDVDVDVDSWTSLNEAFDRCDRK